MIVSNKIAIIIHFFLILILSPNSSIKFRDINVNYKQFALGSRGPLPPEVPQQSE